MSKGLLVLSILGAVALAAGEARAQGNAFTYQGRLADGAVPADGSYDFEFRLFDALSGGVQQGPVMAVPGVVVQGGLFTVGLNFGAAFDGASRFLEIAVRPAGGGAHSTIAPRQPLTASPYAIRSATAGNALQLGGVAASQYVVTTDPRLSDARNPLPGSADYVQNGTGAQAASFNVSGNGTVGGTLAGGIVGATTRYDLGGTRILGKTGNANLFVGESAGLANTIGQLNAFVGFEAGSANATATRNTYVGAQAGRLATGGSNTFLGSGAGSNTTTGATSVFVGTAAGNGNTTGGDNVFIGAFTAQDSINTAGDIVLVGANAGRANRGAANTFVGSDAGRSNNTGTLNATLGFAAGDGLTSGSSNVFLGASSGASNTSGGANTLVGSFTDVGAATLTNATAIGSGAVAFASDTIVLGRADGSDTVHVWGTLRVGLETSGSIDVCRNVNVRLSTCSSSLRYKSEVRGFARGLDVVSRLRPIAFRWKDSGAEDVGFAAEEVAVVEPLLATYGEDGRIEGVKYKQITTVLVNAVQELRRENQSLRAELSELRAGLCRAGVLVDGCAGE
jgi:hypothetical protein